MEIRTFEGVVPGSQGELHKYRDGDPVISIGRANWRDSPPLGWIEQSGAYHEFPADQWDAKLWECRRALDIQNYGKCKRCDYRHNSADSEPCLSCDMPQYSNFVEAGKERKWE